MLYTDNKNSKAFMKKYLQIFPICFTLIITAIPLSTLARSGEEAASGGIQVLSLNGKKSLDNPPNILSPAVQMDLESAWKRMAEKILREFLKNKNDKISLSLSIERVDNEPFIHFRATGKNAGYQENPETFIQFDILWKGGKKAMERLFGIWFQPLDLGNEKIELIDFEGDRAAYSTMTEEGMESIYWQKGEHYLEVRRKSGVKDFANRVLSAAKRHYFYEFPLPFLWNFADTTPPPREVVDAPPSGKDSSAVSRAQVLRWTSEYDNGKWAARKIIDGKVGRGHEWSSTKNPPYPQEFVVRLSGERPTTVGGLEINPYTTEGIDRWAKKVSIFLGDSPEGPWTLAGNYTLEQRNQFQALRFNPKSGRYILIQIKSNWGGNYVQLGEVRTIEAEKGSIIGENVALAEWGAEVVRWTSEYDNGKWAARKIIDGKVGGGHEWSSTKNPPYPQEFVVRLSGEKPMTVGRVEINPHITDSKDRWAKKVSIFLGDSPEGPWTLAGNYTLEQRNQFQALNFAPINASHVLIRIESNWKGNYVMLGEVRVIASQKETQADSTVDE